MEQVSIVTDQLVLVQSGSPEAIVISDTETVLTATDSSTVIITGLLGPASSTSISGAYDVDSRNLEDGSTLIYNSIADKWIATRTLDMQILEGGHY